jgi:hypothetical protein
MASIHQRDHTPYSLALIPAHLITIAQNLGLDDCSKFGRRISDHIETESFQLAAQLWYGQTACGLLLRN